MYPATGVSFGSFSDTIEVLKFWVTQLLNVVALECSYVSYIAWL